MVHLCVSVFISGPESSFTLSPTSSCFRRNKIKALLWNTGAFHLGCLEGWGKSEIMGFVLMVRCAFTSVSLALLWLPFNLLDLTSTFLSELTPIPPLGRFLCFRSWHCSSVKKICRSLLGVDLELWGEKIVDSFCRMTWNVPSLLQWDCCGQPWLMVRSCIPKQSL